MIPKPLITYIETAIIPRYKEFDKAHNLSHVRTVIEESLALARQYPDLHVDMHLLQSIHLLKSLTIEGDKSSIL